MTRRWAAIPAVVIATALALPGCTHADKPAAQTTTVEVSYDDLLSQKNITRQASLAAGDTLRVVLASNASTGYQWSAQAQISDATVLSQTGHQTVAPSEARPGAAGTEVWTFEALKPGTATVTTTYGQPWPSGAKNAWTFTAAVTVRESG